MNKVLPENLLVIGEVVRPHGLKGLLKVRSYARSEESFLDAGIIFLKSDLLEVRKFRLISLKPLKNAFLLKLEGLNSLEEAENYRGAKILISKDTLRKETEGEFFWFELIGLDVYLDSGRYVGVLQDIITTGSNDIYVIREGKTEVLIPATYEVIHDIDLEKKRMIIREIEGLLDINAV